MNRFTHSRIRPFFSGCGRSIASTIDDIENFRITVDDLPLITVLNNDGFYFSLNNRRLYVLKYIRERGLLFNRNNLVSVRIKSANAKEIQRYTISRCSLHARIMPIKQMNNNNKDEEEDNNEDDEDLELESEHSGSDFNEKPVQFDLDQSHEVYPRKVTDKIMSLQNLLEKGKTKTVIKQIKDWIDAELLSSEQLLMLMNELSIDEKTVFMFQKPNKNV
jgi:hypothetical protein